MLSINNSVLSMFETVSTCLSPFYGFIAEHVGLNLFIFVSSIAAFENQEEATSTASVS